MLLPSSRENHHSYSDLRRWNKGQPWVWGELGDYLELGEIPLPVIDDNTHK